MRWWWWLAVVSTADGETRVNTSVAFPTLERFYDDHLVKREAVVLLDVWGRDHPAVPDGAAYRAACRGSGRTVVDRCSGISAWVPRFATNDYAVRVSRATGSPVGRLSPAISFDQDREGCGELAQGLYVGLEATTISGTWGTATIGPGDAVFAPAGQRTTAKGAFLRYCWLDASNLIEIRAALRRGEAYLPGVEPGTFLEALDRVDTAMDRSPRDLAWHEFVTWPRELERSRASRSSFDMWQQELRWRWKIVADTIPELGRPTLSAVAYEAATLTFHRSYKPLANDDARFGVEVEFDSDPALFLNASTSGHGAERGLCFVQGDGESVGPLLPGRIYRFRSRIVYGDARGPWSPYLNNIQTPARREPSQPARPIASTGEGPGKVRLDCDFPEDDGGDPVRGWIVRGRHLDIRAFADDWVGLGSFAPSKSLTVSHLMPPACDRNDHKYRFQIAAYNRLGLGAWSDATDVVAPGCIASKSTIAGRGVSEAYVDHHLSALDDDDDDDWSVASRSISAQLEALRPHRDDSTLPVADVTDRALRLWLPGDYGRSAVSPRVACDLWTSHFSPPHFDVAAQLALADPLDASRPTPRTVAHHRILLARRGGLSFAKKALNAQRAGALALVVFDDGQCDHLDQYCVPGADRARNEGFAALDNARAWRDVRIPVGLILQTSIRTILDAFPAAYPDAFRTEL